MARGHVTIKRIEPFSSATAEIAGRRSSELTLLLLAAVLMIVAGDAAVSYLAGNSTSDVVIFGQAMVLLAVGVAILARGVHARNNAAADRHSIEHRALARHIFDRLDEGVLLADLRVLGQPLVYVNPAFERITGFSVNEAIGKNCRYLQGADRLQPEIGLIREAIEARRPLRVTLRNYRKDGRMFWNSLDLSPVFDGTGEATHFLGLIHDVTEAKEMHDRLEKANYLDRLTAVPNRYLFCDQLVALLEDGDGEQILIVKIDVARFHEINTSYGYEVGDLLLREIADRLSRITGGWVGRLGADEFGWATTLASAADASAALARVQSALAATFVLPGAAIELRFALGYTLGQRGDDPLTLIRQAGVALHESRRTPLREPRGFDQHTDVTITSRIKLTRELQQAVGSGDFQLHYQPKVSLPSGMIIGGEALIRWRHPVFGLQPPSRFIPIAEETGLILDIGNWVVREAARFAANLGDRQPLSLSINVSPMQFMECDICQLLEEALSETGAKPGSLILELTESVFADSTGRMVSTLTRLREMGVGLSIDDFGTGYSSLRYLEAFPISEVKLDRAFVHALNESRTRQVIVDGIIKLGLELGIDVVAEGIETNEELSALQELGCTIGQGYLFGSPMPESEFLESIQCRNKA